jgi:hypothetical protein
VDPFPAAYAQHRVAHLSYRTRATARGRRRADRVALERPARPRRYRPGGLEQPPRTIRLAQQRRWTDDRLTTSQLSRHELFVRHRWSKGGARIYAQRAGTDENCTQLHRRHLGGVCFRRSSLKGRGWSTCCSVVGSSSGRLWARRGRRRCPGSARRADRVAAAGPGRRRRLAHAG